MYYELLMAIAIIILVLIIILKEMFIDPKHQDNHKNISENKNIKKNANGIVGFEDVEFNSDIQDTISVPLSQDEIDVLVARLNQGDKLSKNKKVKDSKNHKGDRKAKRVTEHVRFNKLKLLLLYSFNIIALFTVSHPYSNGLVTRFLDKLSTIGNSVVQLILSFVSIAISIIYSIIDELASYLYDKYELFANEYLSTKLLETAALAGLTFAMLFVNSIFINKLISKRGITAKFGVLLNFLLMLITIVILISSILELYGKPSVFNFF